MHTLKRMASDKIIIRGAVQADLDWIMPQLEEFADFAGHHHRLFPDAEYARVTIGGWITDHLFLVAERGDDKMGFISGLVHPHLFRPQIMTLTETFWWVPTEFRGSRAGLMLINAFTKWGRENVNQVVMGLEHHSPVNEKTLIKRGYALSEKLYLMEVS